MVLLFAIYSCKKYIDKAEFLYNLLIEILDHNRAHLFIIYGSKNDLNINYQIIDDKYIVLNCGDNYEDLMYKTQYLLKTFIDLKIYSGLIKCDDDIIPNPNAIRNFIDYLEFNPNVEYIGKVQKIENSYISDFHYGKCSDEKFNTPINIQKTTYAAGPIYYLNRYSIELLNYSSLSNDSLDKENKEDNLKLCFNEDIMIGNSDEIEYFKHSSIQNINSKFIFIFTYLNGGLGNQLFQVASCYSLAKDHNMIPVLLYSDNNLVCSHNKSLKEFTSTIFSKMLINKFDININKFNPIVINEMIDDYDCFSMNYNIILDKNRNYLLTGYFQNVNYFARYSNEIRELFSNHEICNKLSTKYPKLKESYFIHIRRGDYLKDSKYMIDYDFYFQNALKNIDKESHIYIISNDIEYCKSYSIIKNLNLTFIENDELTTLESLYFMSLCEKGGICSNSTFSWWGAYLGWKKSKTIIIPKEWMVDRRYPINMNFENSLLIGSYIEKTNYDDINSFYLSSDCKSEEESDNKLLFFDIFIKDDKLWMICPVYNIVNPITFINSITVIYNGLKLEPFGYLDKFDYEPTLIFLFKINNVSIISNINVNFNGITKSYRLKHKPNIIQHKLALTTLFKNDYKLIRIFQPYYEKQGVDFFYMYYNGILNDEIKELYNSNNIKLIEWNFKYLHNEEEIPIHHAQTGQMHHAIYKYGKGNIDYMIFCDLDEYLVINGKTLRAAVEDNPDMIGFCNRWSKTLDGLIPDMLPKTFKSSERIPFPSRSKCIYNVNKITTIGIHFTNNINGDTNNDLFHFYNWSGKVDRDGIIFSDDVTIEC
jgi:hypothetical protein